MLVFIYVPKMNKFLFLILLALVICIHHGTCRDSSSKEVDEVIALALGLKKPLSRDDFKEAPSVQGSANSIDGKREVRGAPAARKSKGDSKISGLPSLAFVVVRDGLTAIGNLMRGQYISLVKNVRSVSVSLLEYFRVM